jgi:hypothetical protein
MEVGMIDSLWLFAVAGGPLILAVIFAFVFIRRRRLTRAEFEAGERGARRLYEKDPPAANRS